MKAPYALVNGRPKLEDSYVLFLDILGSGAMASAADAQLYLDRLFDAVNAAHGAAVNTNPGTPYALATFTDHIVVGWPSAGWDTEMSLGSVVTIAAYFQYELARHGFVARGGMARGGLYMSDKFVFGPGLIRAHDLEQTTASWPRVVLDIELARIARSDLRWYGRVMDAPQDDEIIFTTEDRQAFVNYLYVIKEAEVEDDDYVSEAMNHRTLIVDGLREHAENPAVLLKYEWLARYHDYFCANYYPGRAEFRIDGSEPEGFTAFHDFVKGVGDL